MTGRAQSPTRKHHQSASHKTNTRSAVPGFGSAAFPSPRATLSSPPQFARASQPAGPISVSGETPPSPRQPKEANKPKPRRGGQKAAHGGAKGGTVCKPRNRMNPAVVSGWPHHQTHETPANQSFRVGPDLPKPSPADRICHSLPNSPKASLGPLYSQKPANRVSASPNSSSSTPIRSMIPRYRLHNLRLSSPDSK